MAQVAESLKSSAGLIAGLIGLGAGAYIGYKGARNLKAAVAGFFCKTPLGLILNCPKTPGSETFGAQCAPGDFGVWPLCMKGVGTGTQTSPARQECMTRCMAGAQWYNAPALQLACTAACSRAQEHGPRGVGYDYPQPARVKVMAW